MNVFWVDVIFPVLQMKKLSCIQHTKWSQDLTPYLSPLSPYCLYRLLLLLPLKVPRSRPSINDDSNPS